MEMWKYGNGKFEDLKSLCILAYNPFSNFHISTFLHSIVMINSLKYFLLLSLCTLVSAKMFAQVSYNDSLEHFQQEYVKNHGVVKGDDKKHLRFFPVMAATRVQARVERIYDAPWFKMETSSKEKQVYRVYAVLHFSLHDTLLKLHVYQSQRLMETKEYADYLFIPFTDFTSGNESYDNGRYIDLMTTDLETGIYFIDFNKAYNPYCAYVSGQYSCPVPPKENDLPVAIRAGEMKFEKEH